MLPVRRTSVDRVDEQSAQDLGQVGSNVTGEQGHSQAPCWYRSDQPLAGHWSTRYQRSLSLRSEVRDEVLREEIDIEEATNPHMTYEDQRLAVISLGDESYTKVEWEEPYYRGATYFLSETLPRLWRLGPPDDVRIVFWFEG